MPDYRLAGKVALITGGARGIGAAIARRLAADGALIVVADVDLPEAEAVAASLPGAIAARCDVTAPDEIAALATQVEAHYGRLDILVNNASVLDVGSLDAMTIESYRRVIDINLNGAVYMSKALAPLIVKTGGGSIIHISSINGIRGRPGNLAYATAKGGIVNLGRVMAAELGRHGITVNVICPGFIDTRMAIIPGTTTHESETEWFRDIYMKYGHILLGRYGKPEDIAGAVSFLASDDSRYITGQVLSVDGGITATF